MGLSGVTLSNDIHPDDPFSARCTQAAVAAMRAGGSPENAQVFGGAASLAFLPEPRVNPTFARFGEKRLPPKLPPGIKSAERRTRSKKEGSIIARNDSTAGGVGVYKSKHRKLIPIRTCARICMSLVNACLHATRIT